MKLVYKAITSEGKQLHGIIEARDVREAAVYLRSKQYYPVSIKPQTEAALVRMVPFGQKVGGSQIIFFTRQLASMLGSGLTLMQALNVFRDQMQHPKMKEVINDVILDVEAGKSFSDALAKYPNVFNPVYTSLVKAAETSGLLDKVFTQLADNLEKSQKLKSAIKSALLYPIIVVLMMIGVMFIMMIFVIPQLGEVYTALDIELPLPTLIIVTISKYSVQLWPIMFGGVIALVIGFQRWNSTAVGRRSVDIAVLRIPIFGKLIKQRILTEFGRTLGLLIGTGSLVVESLRQSSDVVGNVIYREEIQNVATRVEKGVPVGDAMAASELFPQLLIQMVRIGEETGKLDETLGKSAEYFEREAEQTVKTLTTALEPMIMIVLGVGVAFLLISIITPIYKITSSF